MLERYSIRITPRACDDLAEICSYIEKDSPRQAALVAGRLLSAVDALDILPRRFTVHQHRKDSNKTVHAMPVRPFIVYYRVVETSRTVEVLAVRHGSRQQPRGFS